VCVVRILRCIKMRLKSKTNNSRIQYTRMSSHFSQSENCFLIYTYFWLIHYSLFLFTTNSLSWRTTSQQIYRSYSRIGVYSARWICTFCMRATYTITNKTGKRNMEEHNELHWVVLMLGTSQTQFSSIEYWWTSKHTQNATELTCIVTFPTPFRYECLFITTF
jgi:hypothetical protein